MKHSQAILHGGFDGEESKLDFMSRAALARAVRRSGRSALQIPPWIFTYNPKCFFTFVRESEPGRVR